jgi:hypothetical protein
MSDATAAAARENGLLRVIVWRGGSGHWTWRLVDAQFGKGTAERWASEVQALCDRDETGATWLRCHEAGHP